IVLGRIEDQTRRLDALRKVPDRFEEKSPQGDHIRVARAEGFLGPAADGAQALGRASILGGESVNAAIVESLLLSPVEQILVLAIGEELEVAAHLAFVGIILLLGHRLPFFVHRSIYS